MRSIFKERELAADIPEQMLLFEEAALSMKEVYPSDSKRQEIEEKFKNIIHEELNLLYFCTF